MLDTPPKATETFDLIRERDVDLALVLAMRASPELRALFTAAAGVTAGTLSFVGNSVRTEDGREADVVLVQQRDDVRDRIEIENKIAAPFQCGQAASYRERARRRAAEDGAHGAALLFAPAAYLERAGAETALFDGQVTYESSRDVLEREGPWGRAVAALLEQAIGQSRRRGAGAGESEARTAFFSDFAALAAEYGLPALPSQPRAAGAGFLWYPRAGTLKAPSGWAETFGNPGPALVAKFVHGHADIELSGAASSLDLAAARAALDAAPRDLEVVISKGSARIRAEAPVLDPDASLEAQLDDATAFARCLVDLLEWWDSEGCDALFV